MSFGNLLRIATFGVVMATGLGAALANTPTPQNHHCKLPDGSMDMKKTKKECAAAKGTWAKDADAAKPATPPATAAAPKPAAPVAPTPAPAPKN